MTSGGNNQSVTTILVTCHLNFNTNFVTNLNCLKKKRKFSEAKSHAFRFRTSVKFALIKFITI